MNPLDRLPELIGAVYDAALKPEEWPRAMKLLEDTLGGPAVLHSENLVDASAMIAASTFDPEWLDKYVRHYVTTNVWMQHAVARPHVDIATEEIAPKDVFEQSEWLHDWLKPQGLYYALSSFPQRSETLVTSLTIMRSPRRSAWTPEEFEFWRILTGHVVRAVQTHQRLVAARLRTNAGLSGLEALGTAVLLVGGDGRLLWANARAEALLSAGDGLVVRDGGLAATNRQAAERLVRLIAEAASTAAGKGASPGGALKAPRRGGPPLDLLVAPLSPSAQAFGLFAPAALVFAHDPAGAPATSEAALRRLWRLSPAEARLLLGLLRGLDLDAYAASAGVAPSTARTLLKRLMRKMGESRQAGAIRAVLANPVARLAAGLDRD